MYHEEGNGKPLKYSCLGNPRDGGAWWAAVYGVAQSQTRLKRLSCRSSSLYVSDIRSCEREKYAMREKRNEKETYKDLGFWLIYLVHRKFPPSKLKSVKHRKYAAQLRPHLL